MSEHRPWMVAIPRTEIREENEEVTICLTAPRATPSFRRILIPRTLAFWLQIRSVRLGSLETGRELLETGPVSGAVFSDDVHLETFDVPIERGQAITLVVRNVANAGMIAEGVLLGLGPSRA